MIDIFTQFLNIINGFGVSVLDIACSIYIFKQITKLIIFIIKKIKGDK